MDEKNHVAHLETQIKSLKTAHASFGNTDDWEELLRIIHQPGYTTPAEILLLRNSLENIMEQTRQLNVFRQGVLAGARAVTPARAAGQGAR